MALQSERSGKAHYVVVCRCPDWGKLEGPYTHNYPPYARIPGIKVYGMLCVQASRMTRVQKTGNKGNLKDRFFSLSLSSGPFSVSYFVLLYTSVCVCIYIYSFCL